MISTSFKISRHFRTSAPFLVNFNAISPNVFLSEADFAKILIFIWFIRISQSWRDFYESDLHFWEISLTICRYLRYLSRYYAQKKHTCEHIVQKATRLSNYTSKPGQIFRSLLWSVSLRKFVVLCLVDYSLGNFCVRLALLEEILLFFWSRKLMIGRYALLRSPNRRTSQRRRTIH